MELANDILKKFAKVVANESKTKAKTETTVYATIVESDNKIYAKIDGSEILTPINTTAAVKEGERVTVMIKNHTATVTGNLTSPSASSADVDNVNTKISEFEIIMAHSITTDDLNALNANINNIKVITADIQELEAVNAQIESLEAMFTELEYVDATNIDVVNAEIEKLEAMFADVEDLSAEELEAVNAEIDNLKAYTADFTYVSAEKLEAVEAKIDNLVVGDLSAKYANIDFSNIGQAAMEYFYAQSGLIKDVTVGDETITGELVGVTIKGDLIEANTIMADKLVIKGEDGLYYKLNFDGGTFLEGEEVPTDSLHGSVITANSITAEKISVKDLVAFDATIGGFNITENSLYSGVKESVDNTTRGVYLDNDGQVNFGDANNYIKYYKDTDDIYKLVISTENLKANADGSVEAKNGSFAGDISADTFNIKGSTISIEQQSITESTLAFDETTLDLTGEGSKIIADCFSFMSDKTIYATRIWANSSSASRIKADIAEINNKVISNKLLGGVVKSSGDIIAAGNITASGTVKGAKVESTGNIISSGYMRATGELQSTTKNGLRVVQGNYGAIFHNNGSEVHLLATASGDQYGTWSSLRPFKFNLATGAVTMAQGVTVSDGLTVSGGITCNNNMSITGTLGVTGDLTSQYQVNNNGIWAKAGIAVGSHSSTPRIKHIHTGSVALTPGSTSSTGVKLLAHSTIQGWYSGATVTKTAIVVTNGDGKANGVHIEGATYTSDDGYWYVVCNSAIGGIFRVNYVVICW